MRHKVLEQPTAKQSQVATQAATADLDNEPTDDDQPIAQPEPTNQGDKLFIHYRHEKRFESCKRDLHRVYEDVFKDTTAMYTKLIVGNRNRRDAQNELIRKRPPRTLLQNIFTQRMFYCDFRAVDFDFLFEIHY